MFKAEKEIINNSAMYRGTRKYCAFTALSKKEVKCTTAPDGQRQCRLVYGWTDDSQRAPLERRKTNKERLHLRPQHRQDRLHHRKGHSEASGMREDAVQNSLPSLLKPVQDPQHPQNPAVFIQLLVHRESTQKMASWFFYIFISTRFSML